MWGSSTVIHAVAVHMQPSYAALHLHIELLDILLHKALLPKIFLHKSLRCVCCLQLASLADVYVNDAFGTAHRAHASTEGVAKHLSPCVGGFLLQKELDYLMVAVQTPKRPFCAIVGGAKVSTKIGVLEELLKKCDVLILG